ncbi:MAG: glycosyltransferase family 2 protein [Thermoanaerobaculia bacterium]
MKLIIQIPAYNEEATIGKTIADLPKKIDGITTIETLLIDDGSTDGTVAAAKKAGITHVVRLLNHRGLATAFTSGIDASLRLGADIVVNTDADNQYRGADVARLVGPIVRGESEVVIGDRDVKNSPHMGPLKKMLQALGSRAVGMAAGMRVGDATSGFRAFSREAAFQINVFNPFTYTLETIIQAGKRNLQTTSVVIGTNPPARPSRLYQGIGSYLRKSVVTIFRIYTLYKPLKTFFLIGALLLLAGTVLGGRFVYYFVTERSSGHVQSLILAAVLLIAGFQTMLIGLLADLISVNRRLSEDILIRLKKLEQPSSSMRPARRRDREDRSEVAQRDSERTAPKPVETQWVWLVDEAKLDAEDVPVRPPAAPEPEGGEASRSRRRRRRRGPRHFSEAREHNPRVPKNDGGNDDASS